ncbi:hypothetical protein HAL07_15540 [Helicobacter ailurogastricus]|uniref:Uncharacterized protein n=1 Tax=Helicobacter ailurogastricus TaxID=1578720 RepID=A0A0K2Y5G8_9HELI|nr:hypothetical protein HAL011_08420 [Helicobacter ailurogastricus]CRF42074.1 hypothetical protein HAL013_02280 [Helicobacter ailurogastricus]CRF44688.1 hypothetical protein HAL09_12890 [Helicobacter ailurogastricus]CRF53089.1 hypothetical protein HAL07_15540 [Helicobacter ailurogastricus]
MLFISIGAGVIRVEPRELALWCFEPFVFLLGQRPYQWL